MGHLNRPSGRRAWWCALLMAAVAGGAVAAPRGRFERVAIGGGGWFTGILFHPQSKADDPVLYCRGDLAGLHRWDAAGARWLNLGDSLPSNAHFLRGCDGMAVDPGEASMNTVYAMLGEYDDEHNYWINAQDAAHQGVWRSTDRGAHWQQILAVRCGSNQDSRWAGEPLAVDPRSGGRVLYAGTRKDGLWVSTNANEPDPTAVKFVQRDPQALGQVPAGVPRLGIRCFAFDPRSGPENTVIIDGVRRTKHVYTGLPGLGVWGTHDGGLTWEKVAGGRSPRKEIKRLAVLSDGTLVVAHEGGLSRFVDDIWTPIGPAGVGAISAIAVVPGTDAMIGFGGNAGGYHRAIYRAADAKTVSPTAGWTVARFSDKTAVINTPVPWTEWTALCFTDCAALNPARPDEVWTTDVYGCWMLKDAAANPIEVFSQLKDLEITVATCLDSPSSGEVKLWVGCGDVRGFKFKDLREYPRKWLAEEGEADCTYGLTTSAGNSRYVAKISAGSPWGGFDGAQYRFSTDGGETWTKGVMPPLKENLGHAQLALSCEATARPRAVLLADEGLFVTDDGFAADTQWTKVSAAGLPHGPGAWGIGTLQADKRAADLFYMAITPDKGQMQVFVSRDGGHTWAAPETQITAPPGADALPAGSRHPWRFTLSTSPVNTGELWLSAGSAGLYSSTDAARTFRRVAGVRAARAVAVGLPRAAPARGVVYVIGQVGDAWGVFLSEDSGASWTQLNDDRFQIPGGDWGAVMVADGREFGRFFVGDGATGVTIGTVTP